jgi:hypothetical protein
VDERELLLLDLQLGLTEEVLERAEHEGERCAELVRDVGEERRLGPIQLRQRLQEMKLENCASRSCSEW